MVTASKKSIGGSTTRANRCTKPVYGTPTQNIIIHSLGCLLSHELHRAALYRIDAVARLVPAALGVLEPAQQNMFISHAIVHSHTQYAPPIEPAKYMHYEMRLPHSPAVVVLLPHVEAHHAHALVVSAKLPSKPDTERQD
jgi:hypothetical protein